MTASRRVDGQPETEADARFFELRESGYTGPIRWDAGQMPVADTTSPEADILRDMAKRRGEEVDW